MGGSDNKHLIACVGDQKALSYLKEEVFAGNLQVQMHAKKHNWLLLI
jgi:hypothetical protein